MGIEHELNLIEAIGVVFKTNNIPNSVATLTAFIRGMEFVLDAASQNEPDIVKVYYNVALKHLHERKEALELSKRGYFKN